MTSQDPLSFWDLSYEDGSYLEHWESPHTPPELAALVAVGAIPAGARVLDLGCGAGAEAIFLARHGFQAVGLDSSAKAIEIARGEAAKVALEVDFRIADATDLPFSDRSFGFASDRGCWHVIDRDQRASYARELARVLQPEAPFLLRGAREDDEEEGVVAVNSEEIDRYFAPRGFTRGPIIPLDLVAASGNLAGNLAILRRST